MCWLRENDVILVQYAIPNLERDEKGDGSLDRSEIYLKFSFSTPHLYLEILPSRFQIISACYKQMDSIFPRTHKMARLLFVTFV